jgi:LmbE family N-acetylglucosaminyl deacetylase
MKQLTTFHGEAGRSKAASALLSFFAAALLVLLLWPGEPRGTALAAERADAVAVEEAIARLPVVGSVLFTGAHPDDENSALIAHLAKRLHLRTAYLSATRGDGGQNLIGTEQYEALGILRTEELLAARRLDGAEQYFAQAYDFGFSKSADESLAKWGREAALGDFVRIIRRFRPDIIISRFSGTPSDGHGHHQAAGILVQEAFRAAGDPMRFPEQLREGLQSWQAARLFVNQFRPGGGEGFTMDIGEFSPVHGRTYAEIGLEGRSMHRSQGMGGSTGRRGPFTAAFRVTASKPGSAAVVQGLFSDVDLTFNRFTRLTRGSDAVRRRVETIESAIQGAQSALTPNAPSKVLPFLGRGLAELRELRSELQRGSTAETERGEALFLLRLKEKDFAHAIALAGAAEADAISETSEIIPGEPFEVAVTAMSRTPELKASLQTGSLVGPPGWKIEPLPAAGNAGTEARFRVTAPADAPVSQPYWLVAPRQSDYFTAPSSPYRGDAENPPLLTASVTYSLAVNGQSLPVEQTVEVVHRFADRVYGERIEPLTVVPPLAVWIDPPVAVFPSAASQQYVLVRVRNHRRTAQNGVARLDLPPGWRSEPVSQEFALRAEGDESAVRFQVSAPSAGPAARELLVKAVAEAGGQSFSTGYQVIDYPHIVPRHLFRPTESRLLRFDVSVAPGLRVGYVMGSGDEVPEALRQMGVGVEQLNENDLSFGDLGKYDVIVTGIRAYEVRRDLSANHARLMEFVRNGGLLIGQYGRKGGFSEPLGPYPFDLGDGPRVTVEEAPIAILEPAHPLFQSPNRITAADFDGWVQERGIYFMETWDPQYKPLLESHDPGEDPLRGGMLLASYGRGYYLYTGYAWFRQLPAGVPGAYRLFANMISLGKTLNP